MLSFFSFLQAVQDALGGNKAAVKIRRPPVLFLLRGVQI
jgi:hypothetical protein